jgi:aminopeptidase N
VFRAFEQTKLMPTYLIGFVISDFAMNNGTFNDRGVEFRAYSRPDAINNTQFGIATAVRALEQYEKHFNVFYDWNKLDQVALPVFNSGGMENYGIIFYRQDFFLYEQGVTTVYWKEYIAATVTHEVCHKFIGNLVTYHWWSVLWMAEGFCRYLKLKLSINLQRMALKKIINSLILKYFKIF